MSVYHYDNARVARRLIGFLLVVLGVVLMTGLYYVKIRAQSAKVVHADLIAQIEKENLALNVLRAEIAHLESPERLSQLAFDNLGLVPTQNDRVITLKDIDGQFPIRDSGVLNIPDANRSGVGGAANLFEDERVSEQGVTP